MSDRMRWRYGDTNPVVAAVDSGTVIEIGDLVYQDWSEKAPHEKRAFAALDFCRGPVPQIDLETDQELFADKFLGVAMQRSRVGEDDSVRVATTGIFEFDCPVGTFELGDLVGVDVSASGKRFLSQQVVLVRGSKCAIARVAKRAPRATTSVLIDIRSTVMTGGVKGTSSEASDSPEDCRETAA